MEKISNKKPLRNAAIYAGFSYLLSFAIVVYVNFGIHDKLIIDGKAAETASNILAHPLKYRIGIVGDLVYCVLIVVQTVALYIILRTVHTGIALLAALWRFVWVLMWLVMTLHLFDALRLLSDNSYGQVMQADLLHALVRLNLSTRFDYYYVGLLFTSLASTAFCWLWIKSRYIPRGLGIFGLVSSAWCILCTTIFYINPDFSDTVNLWWFDTPMGLFDIASSIWLIVKGIRVKPALKN